MIRDLAASSPEMLAIFSDGPYIAAALAFEAALAKAQAKVGLLDDETAEAIVRICKFAPDPAELAKAAAHAGTLAIPLVQHLRGKAAEVNALAAKTLHRGATSQDVADTALMIQSKAAMALVRRDSAKIIAALRSLAMDHAATPQLGRSLLQGALPITFGLKAAQWMLAAHDAVERLDREAEKAIALQLGGPVGTMNGLGGEGDGVAGIMAAELGLALPSLPWHARRGAVCGLGAALAILTGVVGKIARDISLMAQGEVGEAFEPAIPGRGGSSAMPHNTRNPTGCQVALSAALRAPHLAATLMSGLAAEHERGLGGWQAEAPVLADLFEVTHGALAAMAPVLAELQVDVAAMARNLAAAKVGEDVGEAEAMTLRAVTAK